MTNVKWVSLEEARAMYPPPALSEELVALLPDVRLITIKGDVVTIETNATGKEIFDAEAELRRQTGVMYELMCGRKQDQNKLRVKLARFRGIGDAT